MHFPALNVSPVQSYKPVLWLFLLITLLCLYSALFSPYTLCFTNPALGAVFADIIFASPWTIGVCMLFLLPGKFKWLCTVMFAAGLIYLPLVLLVQMGFFKNDQMPYETDRLTYGPYRYVNFRRNDKHGHFWYYVVQQRDILPGVYWSRSLGEFDNFAVGLIKVDANKLSLGASSGPKFNRWNIDLNRKEKFELRF